MRDLAVPVLECTSAEIAERTRVPRERDGLGGLSPRAPILFRVVSGVSVSYVVQGDVSWRRITFDWVAQ